jgi:hypothetical protein
VYASPQGSIVVFEQRGPSVRATFSDAAGDVVGQASLTWNPQSAAFVGSGRIAVDDCKPSDGPTTDAPLTEEIHVVNDRVIRDRWLNPESVDCRTGAVLENAWKEKLWYIAK